jgi:hypothetical protein
VSDAPIAPMLEFSTQTCTDAGYVGSGFMPTDVDALRQKPSVEGASPSISLPPLSVVVSILYVLALVGTGVFFLLYFLLSD